jgi:thioredoxin 1
LTLAGGIPNFRLEEVSARRRSCRHPKEKKHMANAVSDNTFEQEVLKSTEPVLVDFFAEWCGPCKAMAPALEQVAKEMQGKVKVVKLDVDQNPGVTGKYGIRAMPTLILFKNGQVTAQHTGALVQKKKLEDWINTSVA